jgi:hypothetical protein
VISLYSNTEVESVVLRFLTHAVQPLGSFFLFTMERAMSINSKRRVRKTTSGGPGVLRALSSRKVDPANDGPRFMFKVTMEDLERCNKDGMPEKNKEKLVKQGGVEGLAASLCTNLEDGLTKEEEDANFPARRRMCVRRRRRTSGWVWFSVSVCFRC